MDNPMITYRGMPHSAAMDARINELAAHLASLNDRITAFHVVVDENDRHKSKGNLFEVRLDLHIPGQEIVATGQQDEDAYVALNKAFQAAERQLEDGVRRRRDAARHRHEGNAH
jgi:ribosomal subunit interface protein